MTVTEVLLRVLVSGAGVLLLFLSFLQFVRKKMTEGIGLAWGIFSVFLCLLGVIPGLAVWTKYIVGKGAVALFLLTLFSIFGVFSLSSIVSTLVMKNRELAMQVSLLNQEHEQFMKELRAMEHQIENL